MSAVTRLFPGTDSRLVSTAKNGAAMQPALSERTKRTIRFGVPSTELILKVVRRSWNPRTDIASKWSMRCYRIRTGVLDRLFGLVPLVERRLATGWAALPH